MANTTLSPLTLIFGRRSYLLTEWLAVLTDQALDTFSPPGDTTCYVRHDREKVSRETELEYEKIVNKILGIEVRGPGDQGSGVRHVTPVVEAMLDPGPGISSYEFPEMSLHPGAQVELAQAFVAALVRNPERAHIMATHSEHMMLRLLRRIREGKLSCQAVKVLYVEDTGKIKTLRIDDKGEFLDRWPNGFFDERVQELL